MNQCPALMLVAVAFTAGVSAHGVSGKDAVFLQSVQGPAIGPLMYLGAKHMVTGYDHLAFLVGVIFFLFRLRQIALYVSLFSLGHSITLLAGVFFKLHVDPHLVEERRRRWADEPLQTAWSRDLLEAPRVEHQLVVDAHAQQFVRSHGR